MIKKKENLLDSHAIFFLREWVVENKFEERWFSNKLCQTNSKQVLVGIKITCCTVSFILEYCGFWSVRGFCGWYKDLRDGMCLFFMVLILHISGKNSLSLDIGP